MSRWFDPARARQSDDAGHCGLVGGTALVLVLVLIFPARVRAQSESPSQAASQSKAQQGSAPTRTSPTQTRKHKIGPLDISGSWRVRMETWDWFAGDTGNSTYVFPHSLLRVAIGQESKHFDWQLEAAQIMILALPTNAVVAAPQGQLGLGGTYYAANGSGQNNVNGFVKQAYVRFKGLGNAQLRLGRFEYFDGTEVTPRDATLATLVQTRTAQRLIGASGWAAVGRSYDGAQFGYDLGKANITLVGARATRGVFQVDAMGEVDADIYYGALTLPVEAKEGAGELRLFGLGYIDHRAGVLKTDNRPSAVRAADHGDIQIGTYGGNYLHVFNTPSSGKYDIVVWAAVQTGSWGLLTHRAGAFVGEFGWQPPVKTMKPWLRAGYSYGSGDGNSQAPVHESFFQVLPTPRVYARFPFYNMENNEDLYGSLKLHPHSRLSLRTELHALRLSSRNDLWYAGGGVFQQMTFGYLGRPSNGNRSLANVWDLSAGYQATRAFDVDLYYAHAWGKSVIASIYPKDRNGQFFYIETNLRF